MRSFPHAISQALGRGSRDGKAFLPDPDLGDAPLRVASGAPRVASYRVNLAAARTQPERIALSGNAIWVSRASDVEAELVLRLETPQGAPHYVRRGFSLSGFPFSEVWIDHAAQTTRDATGSGRPQWIELAAGFASAPREFVLPAERPVGDQSISGSILLAIATTTQILPARARRRNVVLYGQFLAAATSVWIKADGGAGNAGINLYVSAITDTPNVTLEYSGTIWARAQTQLALIHYYEVYQ